MSDKKKEEKKVTLEERFEMLEAMIEKMEDEELPLEEAFDLYSNGMKLLAGMNEEIDKVEKKVLILKDGGETDEF